MCLFVSFFRQKKKKTIQNEGAEILPSLLKKKSKIKIFSKKKITPRFVKICND